MPFTFAHPALVLPLTRLPKRTFSLTGLVIGSMVPDAEYFIRMQADNRHFHTVPGLFYFDLPAGLALYVLFRYVMRPALLAHLPRLLSARFMTLNDQYQLDQHLISWVVISLSILTGAASHLLWDSFTHSRGYFVRQIGFFQLHIILGSLRFHVYELLQYASSIVGLLVIAWVIYRLPQSPLSASRPRYKYFWIMVIIVSFTVLSLKYGCSDALDFEDWIVSTITSAIAGLLCASLYYRIIVAAGFFSKLNQRSS